MQAHRKLDFLFWVLLLSVSAVAQERAQPSSDSQNGRQMSGGPAMGGISTAAAPAAREAGYYNAASPSVRYDPMMPNTQTTVFQPGPALQGTSFCSVDSYYQWQQFYYYLRTRYSMYQFDFSRFYRNREPLVTPQLLKLTMREPVRLSFEMVSAADELQAMLDDLQAGKPVDKTEIAAKAERIRELAKKIRQDQAVSYLDQRKGREVVKQSNVEGLNSISQLRDMVTELHSQLKNMYMEKATSTISVGFLTQPSFESLSKRIERLSKVIENSARHL